MQDKHWLTFGHWTFEKVQAQGDLLRLMIKRAVANTRQDEISLEVTHTRQLKGGDDQVDRKLANVCKGDRRLRNAVTILGTANNTDHLH